MRRLANKHRQPKPLFILAQQIKTHTRAPWKVIIQACKEAAKLAPTEKDNNRERQDLERPAFSVTIATVLALRWYAVTLPLSCRTHLRAASGLMKEESTFYYLNRYLSVHLSMIICYLSIFQSIDTIHHQ